MIGLIEEWEDSIVQLHELFESLISYPVATTSHGFTADIL